MKALIYGAGLSGRQVYKNIKDEVQVIGFLDGDPDKKGHVIADGLPCYGGAESLSDMEFDRIYIASRFWKDIKKILTDNGVSEDRIRVDIPLDTVSDVRNTWLYSYAKAYKNTKLSVAEGGVFRGDFAKYINKVFPDSKLYLFDTFEGFDSRDVDSFRRLQQMLMTGFVSYTWTSICMFRYWRDYGSFIPKWSRGV